VRRVRHLNGYGQGELFATFQYHAFVTDRVGTAMWLHADHRRHATVELTIRDQHLGDGGEAARTASALYSGVLLVMSLAFGALFAWVTHTDRLLRRLPPPGVVRAARLRFMLGLVVYAAAFALSWVSAPLAVALRGLMALYYAFDQASVPAVVEPDDQQPIRRPAEMEEADPLAPHDGER
jgi:hypothetical protein